MKFSPRIQFGRHCEEYGILGIDWTFKEKRRPEKGEICCDSVALIHLTTHRGVCAIINLCHLQVVPEQIKVILRDSQNLFFVLKE